MASREDDSYLIELFNDTKRYTFHDICDVLYKEKEKKTGKKKTGRTHEVQKRYFEEILRVFGIDELLNELLREPGFYKYEYSASTSRFIFWLLENYSTTEIQRIRQREYNPNDYALYGILVKNFVLLVDDIDNQFGLKANTMMVNALNGFVMQKTYLCLDELKSIEGKLATEIQNLLVNKDKYSRNELFIIALEHLLNNIKKEIDALHFVIERSFFYYRTIMESGFTETQDFVTYSNLSEEDRKKYDALDKKIWGLKHRTDKLEYKREASKDKIKETKAQLEVLQQEYSEDVDREDEEKYQKTEVRLEEIIEYYEKEATDAGNKINKNKKAIMTNRQKQLDILQQSISYADPVFITSEALNLYMDIKMWQIIDFCKKQLEAMKKP